MTSLVNVLTVLEHMMILASTVWYKMLTANIDKFDQFPEIHQFSLNLNFPLI